MLEAADRKALAPGLVQTYYYDNLCLSAQEQIQAHCVGQETVSNKKCIKPRKPTNVMTCQIEGARQNFTRRICMDIYSAWEAGQARDEGISESGISLREVLEWTGSLDLEIPHGRESFYIEQRAVTRGIPQRRPFAFPTQGQRYQRSGGVDQEKGHRQIAPWFQAAYLPRALNHLWHVARPRPLELGAKAMIEFCSLPGKLSVESSAST